MLLFLIDENLPSAVGDVFGELGFSVECVSDNSSLRARSDDVIFRYAVEKKAVIVTRDLGFTNPIKFPLEKATGLVIIRFPNEISISTLCTEIRRSVGSFSQEDFCNLLILEPGSARKRTIS